MAIDTKDPALQALVDAVVARTTETIRNIVARDGQVPIVSELRRELALDLDALADISTPRKASAPKKADAPGGG